MQFGFVGFFADDINFVVRVKTTDEFEIAVDRIKLEIKFWSDRNGFIITAKTFFT